METEPSTPARCHAPAPAAQGERLAIRATRSSLWNLVGQTAQQTLGVLAFLLLSRWLTPSDYGLGGMAATVTGVVAVLGDTGVVAGLIRQPMIDREAEATAFWLALGGAGVLALASAAAAPALGWFFNDPRVTGLALAMAGSFLLAVPARVSTAKLSKALRFGLLSSLSFVATVAGLGVACSVALAGAGPWALVAQTAVTFAVQSLLSVLVAPYHFHPRSFSWVLGRRLACFGSQMSGFALGITAGRAGDSFLGGRFLGAQAVGLMSMGLKLMVAPMQRICSSVSGVFLPAVLQIEESRQGRALAGALRLTALATVPISVGVFALAPEIVSLLPQRWAALTSTLRIYALGTLVEPIGWYCVAVMTAHGRSRALLRTALALIPVGWGGTLLGVWAGAVEWLVLAWAVWNAAGATILAVLVARKLRHGGWIWSSMALPVASAASMAIVVRMALDLTGTAARPRGFALGVLVGVASYGLSLATVMRRDWRRMLELLREALRLRAARERAG